MTNAVVSTLISDPGATLGPPIASMDKVQAVVIAMQAGPVLELIEVEDGLLIRSADGRELMATVEKGVVKVWVWR